MDFIDQYITQQVAEHGPLLPLESYAATQGISRKTAVNRVCAGKFPLAVALCGREWRIPAEALRALLIAQIKQAQAPQPGKPAEPVEVRPVPMPERRPGRPATGRRHSSARAERESRGGAK